MRSYCRFKPDDARLDGLGDARLVCCRAGDLVLWDSRLVHASHHADARAPLPREVGGGEAPRLARAACLICCVPAAPHLATAAAEGRPLAEKRVGLVEGSCTTTHWPQETVVTSQGRPGAGVGGLSRLPPEARALVLGERCSTRHRARRRIEADEAGVTVEVS